MANLSVTTNKEREVVDITEEVTKLLPDGSGLVNVFVLHTTAAITTADLDPGTDLDLLDFLRLITPNFNWRHPHNPAHAPSHLLSSLVGPEVTVPFSNGQLQLGAWQRVILIECDGPRERQVNVTIIKE